MMVYDILASSVQNVLFSDFVLMPTSKKYASKTNSFRLNDKYFVLFFTIFLQQVKHFC